jgi:hypothetical protein
MRWPWQRPPRWREDKLGLLILELGELAERGLNTIHMASRDSGPVENCVRCRRDYRVIRQYREYTRLAPEADGHVGEVNEDGTWQDHCYQHLCGLHVGSSMGTLMFHDTNCQVGADVE